MAIRYLEAFLSDAYDEVDVVMFFGGEPTLCPDTIQSACEFFEKGVESGRFKKMPDFTMVSNGTLIDEKMAKIISNYGIRTTISIDGPQEVNDLFRIDRGGSGTFHRIEKGLLELQRQGTSPAMLEATYTIKHRELGYSKNNIKEYLKERFHVNYVMVCDCEDCGDYKFRDPDTLEQEQQDDIFSAESYVKKVLSARRFVDLVCDAGLDSVAIFPNGKIYPCHRFVVSEEFCIADYVDGYYEFTNYDSVLKKIRQSQKLKNSDCKECWAKSVCRRCPADMLLTETENQAGFYCNSETILKQKAVLNCAKQFAKNQEQTVSIQE